MKLPFRRFLAALVIDTPDNISLIKRTLSECGIYITDNDEILSFRARIFNKFRRIPKNKNLIFKKLGLTEYLENKEKGNIDFLGAYFAQKDQFLRKAFQAYILTHNEKFLDFIPSQNKEAEINIFKKYFFDIDNLSLAEWAYYKRFISGADVLFLNALLNNDLGLALHYLKRSIPPSIEEGLTKLLSISYWRAMETAYNADPSDFIKLSDTFLKIYKASKDILIEKKKETLSDLIFEEKNPEEDDRLISYEDLTKQSNK
jgi:hypothetical protein